jgi:putative NADH-flavin reductase
MKIVIFGASGKTGLLLVAQALEQGHSVTAFLRPSASIAIKHPNLTVVFAHLTETMTIRDIVLDADACISALGGASLTKHSPNIINGIDRIVDIMEQAGVKRLIYLSSLGAGESRYYMPRIVRFLLGDILLRVPLADHNINEQRIARSSLNWTIVRPGGLTDGPLTGIVQHGSEMTIIKGSTKISRANVSAFMLQQLADDEYVKKSVWLFE